LGAFCTDAEDYGRGLPHPAAYGAFAHILSKYVREDRALTLEEAVRKMTSYPARIFALKDRGAIRPGAFADLTIFDPGRVNDRASFEKPRREATGIKLVIVNGRVAFENNQAMDNLHGAVIRNGV
jgi:N-acyl-D-aspartate/D-glutamate deacylase